MRLVILMMRLILDITDRQVSRLRKAFVINSSHNIYIIKFQLSKMVQSGGFIGPLSILVLLRNSKKKKKKKNDGK